MTLELNLQRRDPKTGRVIVERETFDPRALGIVIVDLWNWHWCKTATQRVGAFVPRMNKALECARTMGIQVIHCPTDGAVSYVGTPPRERAIAIPQLPVPERKMRRWPKTRGGDCMCGPGIGCLTNFGWGAMCPLLELDDRDLICVGDGELYSTLKHLGLTDLIYMGVHTNCCILAREEGLCSMDARGFNVMLARDVTDGLTEYDPSRGYTPDDGTAEVVAQIEQTFCPSINIAEEFRRMGLWRDEWIVDTVRISPWGVKDRPHEFEKSVTVTLTNPWQQDAEIRYTLDGTEPTAKSKLYDEPFRFSKSAFVRAAAFRDGRSVSLEATGSFARLPRKPRMPDVHLSELEPIHATFPDYKPNMPKKNKSCVRTQLKLRDVKYEKGMGVHAPSHLVYELKPEYDRFVGLAGVDEAPMLELYGFGTASRPTIVFRVFVDGLLAAESPVMRIQHEPWRFDVTIPPGSRLISLVATDAGDGNRLDLGDWVNAGFVLRR